MVSRTLTRLHALPEGHSFTYIIKTAAGAAVFQFSFDSNLVCVCLTTIFARHDGANDQNDHTAC